MTNDYGLMAVIFAYCMYSLCIKSLPSNALRCGWGIKAARPSRTLMP